MLHTIIGMRAGNKDGTPENLGVPDTELYDASKSQSKFKPHSTKRHPEVGYLNKARVIQTIEEMKNRNQYPVSCRAQDMPNRQPWNNFPVSLRTFATIYCALARRLFKDVP